MSFFATLRSLGRNRRSVNRAVAAASTSRFRDEFVVAASVRAGNPPRL